MARCSCGAIVRTDIDFARHQMRRKIVEGVDALSRHVLVGGNDEILLRMRKDSPGRNGQAGQAAHPVRDVPGSVREEDSAW